MTSLADLSSMPHACLPVLFVRAVRPGGVVIVNAVPSAIPKDNKVKEANHEGKDIVVDPSDVIGCVRAGVSLPQTAAACAYLRRCRLPDPLLNIHISCRSFAEAS